MKNQTSVSETFTGKNPQTTYGSIDKLFYEIGLQKIEARRADDRFLEQKAREESRYLAKVSRVLIGLWELTAIIMKMKPGESLVIDGDSGRMYTGRISDEKLKKFSLLPEKVPGRTSLEIDGDGRNERLLAHYTPVLFGNSRPKSWDTKTRKAPIESGSPIVYFFEQKLAETPKNKVQCNTYDEGGQTFMEVFIKDYPIAIGYGKSNKKPYYVLFQGKRTDIE